MGGGQLEEIKNSRAYCSTFNFKDGDMCTISAKEGYINWLSG
jgi:hypothetical protein